MNGTGLFDKAKLATDKYNNSVDEENSKINSLEQKIDMNSRETITVDKDYTTCIAVGPNGRLGQFLVQGGNICLMLAYYESSVTKTFIINKTYTINEETLTTVHGSCYALLNAGNAWNTSTIYGIERANDTIQKIIGLY